MGGIVARDMNCPTVSVYRLAIDQTSSAIDRRAKYYRNLIIVVVVVSLGSMGWAVFSWDWIPLLGCLLLFPICGIYFFLDGQLLQSWRSKLLEPWCQKEFDFLSFQPAIEAVPGLPTGSLRSMLGALPFSENWLVEHELSGSTRKAIAQVLTLIQDSRSDILLSKTVSLTLVVGGLMIATMLWRWEPLLGILVGVIFLGLHGLWRSLRIKRMKKNLLPLQSQVDYDHRQFQGLLSPLSWSPLSDKEKENILNFAVAV